MTDGVLDEQPRRPVRIATELVDAYGKILVQQLRLLLRRQIQRVDMNPVRPLRFVVDIRLILLVQRIDLTCKQRHAQIEKITATALTNTNEDQPHANDVQIGGLRRHVDHRTGHDMRRGFHPRVRTLVVGRVHIGVFVGEAIDLRTEESLHTPMIIRERERERRNRK